MTPKEDDPNLVKLESACSDLKALLQASEKMKEKLGNMETRFDLLEGNLSITSRRVAPIQSLAMSTKALDTRINRALSPALALLDSFKLCESHQHKLADLSSKLSAEKTPEKRMMKLFDYMDCVDELNQAIDSVSKEGEPVIQKLQEVVKFISRTNAADQHKTERLRESLISLKALYETEVDAMRFDGLLDAALLHLQDEFETILQNLRQQNMRTLSENQADHDTDYDPFDSGLGSEQEVSALRRITETLAANDCLDLCIDIYVKVRYRRAAKALMRLNPDYLRTHTPEGIDEMEWETLETAITLWIQHFEVAVKKVLFSEKKLCNQVLGTVMEGLVWPECFIKISDKIIAVFLRFGEGVARSSKEPQKLFKLLDMFESMKKFKLEFSEIFDGEAGVDICTRFRELEKLLIDSSSKVFWEFGLEIEGNSGGFPPPQDGSVPKLVRYAIYYLKYLAKDNYRAAMAEVLRTEQIWKTGILSKPNRDEDLLKDAISNVMEALQRNIESKRSRCRDKILTHIFGMNTYWYIYKRTKNTELFGLLGEHYMKDKYKAVAEESAYMYQKYAWGVLVRILDVEDLNEQGKETIGSVVTEKMENYLKCLDEISQMHGGYYSIQDADLREQIKEATLKLVVPAYAEFLESYSGLLKRKLYPSPQRLQGLVSQVFDGGDAKLSTGVRTVVSLPVPQRLPKGETNDFRRSRSDTSDI
ncbi:hypothetical protein L6164_015518 [Bauhinia variegata]|uniref:Uncharacterized protein n=1 Tax=Bauhinia variegata TaxID=167791 RepID=A0ACB9NKU0_BAUVA|nr:hypothetical protein L6164_015518 [Bauhinia variegata]